MQLAYDAQRNHSVSNTIEAQRPFEIFYMNANVSLYIGYTVAHVCVQYFELNFISYSCTIRCRRTVLPP